MRRGASPHIGLPDVRCDQQRVAQTGHREWEEQTRSAASPTVGRIGPHDGRIPKEPYGETLKGLGVGSGISVLHDEVRHEDLRLGYRHAGAQAGVCAAVSHATRQERGRRLGAASRLRQSRKGEPISRAGSGLRSFRSARAMTLWRARAASFLLTSGIGFGIMFLICSNFNRESQGPVVTSPTEPPSAKNVCRPAARRADCRSFASHRAKEWLGTSMVERNRWHFGTDSDSVSEASGSQKRLSRRQYSEAQPKKGGEHVH